MPGILDGSARLAAFQVYEWYYVIAGLRALTYPSPVRPAGPVSAWWPATGEGRAFLVGSFLLFAFPLLEDPLLAVPVVCLWYLLIAAARAVIYARPLAPGR